MLTARVQVAALQGYLLKNKTRPRECVEEVEAWVVKERETRAKLKKEKEEREAKEKKGVRRRLFQSRFFDIGAQKEEAEAKEKKEVRAVPGHPMWSSPRAQKEEA